MTVRLSPHKVGKILRGYFRGLPQTKIAMEAGVDQASISHYADKFKETAAEFGILAAGKEYQVLNEVESLRSLSVELFKSKLTAEEARQGHKIIGAFLKLGVDPEKHLKLIEVSQKVADPGFIEAAIKLSQIEAETGATYHEIMSAFENMVNQIPGLGKEVVEARAELKFVNDELHETKQKLTSKKEELEKYQNEVKAKVTELGNGLSAKMKQLGVKTKEVEDVASLKTELAQKGWNLQTLLKLGKEFQHGKGN